MIAALTPVLLGLGPVALLVAMGIVFAETGLLVGFFLPGDSLLVTMGVLIAAGALHVPLWLAAAGLVVAAVAGDQLAYVVGRRMGPQLFTRPDLRWFSRARADRARAFFARHGSKAVVLARFVPVVRALTPVVAGVGQMPRRRFTAVNVAGAALWVLGFLSAGFFLGGIPLVAAHVELFALGLIGASVVGAGLLHLARVAARRLSSRARVSTPHRPSGPGRIAPGVTP